MKKIALLIGLLFLAGCSTNAANSGSESNSSSNSNSNSNTSQPDGGVDPGDEIEEPTFEVKDGPILHAWDWSVSMVKAALPDIKEAGYKNVQLSPLHPSKNSNASAYWWNLYQPLGFKVATGNENPLGNKDSLKDLTKEAEKYDINIIMDVVTNHLGGPNDNQLEGGVSYFEPDIYDQNLIHHNGQVGNWNDRERVVTAAIGGYPDLQTDNQTVQGRVKSMLKEYMDCGVKGFRFDAAKHIETPDDDSRYASDYWPEITDYIYTYGQETLGVKPFVYGEILDNACIDINAYTKYISVTDSRQSDDIRNAVVSGNAHGAAGTGSNVGGMSNAVLWAESHDTYENSNCKTTYINTDKLNLTYAIQISRKDATALFFARPDPSLGYQPDKAPQVIGGVTNDYKSSVVGAANKFHNDFLGGSENVYTSGSAVVNVRKTNNNEGALIADVNCTNDSINVTVSGLSDGEYTNVINNQKYTVSNSQVNVTLTKGLCVLEKNMDASNGPRVSVAAEDTIFTSSTYVNIKATNATTSTYSVNGGNPVAFYNSARVQVGSDLGNGKITINVEATNESGSTSKSITVYKTSYADRNFVVINVPNDQLIRVWSWNTSESGNWYELDSDGGLRATNLDRGNYLICKFDGGDPADWSKSKGKTADFARDSGQTIVDYSQLSFHYD